WIRRSGQPPCSIVMLRRLVHRRPAAFFAIIAVLASPAALQAASWHDISPEELAATEPVVDPESSVEVLFKEWKFDNSDVELGNLHSVYVRLKVYTAKGVDELRTIPMHYDAEHRMTDMAARVVKPDG